MKRTHLKLELCLAVLLTWLGSAAFAAAAEPNTEEKKFNHHMPILVYSNAVTVGPSRDFVEDYSPRGFALEYRYRIMPELSVGVLFGVQFFDDKKTSTETFDSGAFWGTHVRQLQTVPLVASVHYYWPLPKGIMPFVGTDLGASYNWRYVDIGWAWVSQDKWHFTVAPQAGVMLPVGGGMAVMVSSKYNYLVKNGDASDEMFVSFHVGLAFVE